MTQDTTAVAECPTSQSTSVQSPQDERAFFARVGPEMMQNPEIVLRDRVLYALVGHANWGRIHQGVWPGIDLLCRLVAVKPSISGRGQVYRALRCWVKRGMIMRALCIDPQGRSHPGWRLLFLEQGQPEPASARAETDAMPEGEQAKTRAGSARGDQANARRFSARPPYRTHQEERITNGQAGQRAREEQSSRPAGPTAATQAAPRQTAPATTATAEDEAWATGHLAGALATFGATEQDAENFVHALRAGYCDDDEISLAAESCANRAAEEPGGIGRANRWLPEWLAHYRPGEVYGRRPGQAKQSYKSWTEGRGGIPHQAPSPAAEHGAGGLQDLDGAKGKCRPDPDPEQVAAARQLMEQRRRARRIIEYYPGGGGRGPYSKGVDRYMTDSDLAGMGGGA